MPEPHAAIRLYQFEGSHFNEKARWALDWKGVDHERVSLLPGPHMPTMQRLTGRSTTPALVDGGAVIPGSTAILEHLERRFPEPPLFPAHSGERQQVLDLIHHFDEVVGPAVRRAKFFEVMEARYAIEAFCAGRSFVTRGLYRLGFPVVGRAMRKGMGIDEPGAAAGRDTTREAFDFVAKTSAADGHLVAGCFTAADLTCAALLMPCVDVAEWGGPRDPATERNRAWLERWRDHPGAEWVRQTYRRHRRRPS